MIHDLTKEQALRIVKDVIGEVFFPDILRLMNPEFTADDINELWDHHLRVERRAKRRRRITRNAPHVP